MSNQERRRRTYRNPETGRTQVAATPARAVQLRHAGWQEVNDNTRAAPQPATGKSRKEKPDGE